MTAPESLPCPCGAVVPVDRWGEHRREECTAAWWRKPTTPALEPRAGTYYMHYGV